MERPVVARHGGALVLRQLPPGFRFHPTDEELVVQYLRRKALACPLPAAVIGEVRDLAGVDPWDLPGANEGEKYFFTLRAASGRKGGRCQRAAGGGYWQAAGKERPVVAARCGGGRVVGVKRALVFHRGKTPRAPRTDWVMHEYRLAAAAAPPKNATHQQEWVVCRVFKRNRSRRTDGEVRQTPANRGGVQQPSPSSSSLSSSSSCVTNSSDQEEVSSGDKDAAAASKLPFS